MFITFSVFGGAATLTTFPQHNNFDFPRTILTQRPRKRKISMMGQPRRPPHMQEEYNESVGRHSQKGWHPDVNHSSPTPNLSTPMIDRREGKNGAGAMGQSPGLKYLSLSQLKMQQGRNQYRIQQSPLSNGSSYRRLPTISNNYSTPNTQQSPIDTSEGLIDPQILLLSHSTPQEHHGSVPGNTGYQRRIPNNHDTSPSPQPRNASIGQGPQTHQRRPHIKAQHPQCPPKANGPIGNQRGRYLGSYPFGAYGQEPRQPPRRNQTSQVSSITDSETCEQLHFSSDTPKDPTNPPNRYTLMCNTHIRGQRVYVQDDLQTPQRPSPGGCHRQPIHQASRQQTPARCEFFDAEIEAGLHDKPYSRSSQQFPVVTASPQRPPPWIEPGNGAYPHNVADTHTPVGGRLLHRRQVNTPPRYRPVSQPRYGNGIPQSPYVTSNAANMRVDVQDGAWQPHGQGTTPSEQDGQQTPNPNASRHKEQIPTSRVQTPYNMRQPGGNMAESSRTKKKSEPSGVEGTRAASQPPLLRDGNFPPPNRPYPKDKFITLVDSRPSAKTRELNANMGGNGSDHGSDHGLEARLLEALNHADELGSWMASRLPQLPQNPHPDFRPQYTRPPKPVQVTLVPSHVFIIHEFIRNLPAGQPSPFKQDIFMDTELCTKSAEYLRPVRNVESYQPGASINGKGWTDKLWAPGPGIKYKNFCVYTNTQSVPSPNGREEITGSCTVYTRKFPMDYEHVPEMDLRAPARKKGSTEDSREAREFNKPAEPIIWQYSAIAHMEGESHRVDAPVPTKIANIDSVEFEVEPSWDDVVKALKTEITREEQIWNWPVSCTFQEPKRLQHPLANTKQEESQYVQRHPPLGWNEQDFFAHSFPQPPQVQGKQPPYPPQPQPKQPRKKTPNPRRTHILNPVFPAHNLNQLLDKCFEESFVRSPQSPDPYRQFSQQMNQQARQPGHPGQSQTQPIQQLLDQPLRHPAQSPIQSIQQPGQHPGQPQGQLHQDPAQIVVRKEEIPQKPGQSLYNQEPTQVPDKSIPQSANQQATWPYNSGSAQVREEPPGKYPHQYPLQPIYSPISVQNQKLLQGPNQNPGTLTYHSVPGFDDEVPKAFDRQSSALSAEPQQKKARKQCGSSAASLQGQGKQHSSMHSPLPELQHPTPQHAPPSLLTAQSPAMETSSLQQPKKRCRSSGSQGGDGKPRGRPQKAAKGDAGQQHPSQQAQYGQDQSQMPQIRGYCQEPYSVPCGGNWQNSQGYVPQMMQPGGGNMSSGEGQRQEYEYEKQIRDLQHSGYVSPYSDQHRPLSQQSSMMPQQYQQHVADGSEHQRSQHFNSTPCPDQRSVRPPPHNNNGNYDPATQQDGAADRISCQNAKYYKSVSVEMLDEYIHDGHEDSTLFAPNYTAPCDLSTVNPPRPAARIPTTPAPATFSNGVTSQVMSYFPQILNSSSPELASQKTPVTAEFLRSLPPAKAQEVKQRYTDLKSGVKGGPFWAHSGASNAGGPGAVQETLQQIETAQRQDLNREAAMKVLEEATRDLQGAGSRFHGGSAVDVGEKPMGVLGSSGKLEDEAGELSCSDTSTEKVNF